MAMTVVNPATGETMKSYTELTAADVTQAITDAHQAFGCWRQTGFTERARLMKRAAAGSTILVMICPDKVMHKPCLSNILQIRVC